ncbi:MAG: hypothetical protein HYV63_01725 [Candidatus Schekmanbacteria bacterium]|nr:hypothetical protein [Candidatus Schekmanbacteria bacterium]
MRRALVVSLGIAAAAAALLSLPRPKDALDVGVSMQWRQPTCATGGDRAAELEQGRVSVIMLPPALAPPLSSALTTPACAGNVNGQAMWQTYLWSPYPGRYRLVLSTKRHARLYVGKREVLDVVGEKPHVHTEAAATEIELARQPLLLVVTATGLSAEDFRPTGASYGQEESALTLSLTISGTPEQSGAPIFQLAAEPKPWQTRIARLLIALPPATCALLFAGFAAAGVTIATAERWRRARLGFDAADRTRLGLLGACTAFVVAGALLIHGTVEQRGAHATYYRGAAAGSPTFLRQREAAIDLRTPWVHPNFPTQDFSADWEGYFTAVAAGPYQFAARYGGFVSVEVDGHSVIKAASTTPKVIAGVVSLPQGERSIRVRYVHGRGVAALELFVLTPGGQGWELLGSGDLRPYSIGASAQAVELLVLGLAPAVALAFALRLLRLAVAALARARAAPEKLRRSLSTYARYAVYTALAWAIVFGFLETACRLLGLPVRRGAAPVTATVEQWVRSHDEAVPKVDGAYQIFCFGSSSMAGNPHPQSSAPRWLEAILKDRVPGRTARVVNFGRPGAPSHFVREAVPTAMSLDPDLLIVYSGHNEFHERNRYLASQTRRQLGVLHRSRLYLTFVDILATCCGDVLWSGQTEVARKLGRDEEDRFMTFYEQNIRAALESARTHGKRVLLGTLTSNLEYPPLGSIQSGALGPEQRRVWLEATAEARVATAEGRLAEAVAKLREAQRANPEHARTVYDLAAALAAGGETAEAKHYYELARDNDRTPLRAPTRINQIVRRLAAEFPNVILVDIEKLFVEHAPNGIPGWTLFEDYCHPKKESYRLMARAFAEAMRTAGLMAAAESWTESEGEAARELAVAVGIDGPAAARLRDPVN